MFCADCGSKMYNHRGKRKRPDENIPWIFTAAPLTP
ncbi:zinc ribbon domain-containing protein [Flavonifractor plautii]|nr:zinc ribbon domain-containing protein [Flavonifractor plautii]